uniref:CARD domain-containing protein n=1 Tax=Oreochromis niloticus TaxID=8128 RepID=A0A669B1N8_ORENI
MFRHYACALSLLLPAPLYFLFYFDSLPSVLCLLLPCLVMIICVSCVPRVLPLPSLTLCVFMCRSPSVQCCVVNVSSLNLWAFLCSLGPSFSFASLVLFLCKACNKAVILSSAFGSSSAFTQLVHDSDPGLQQTMDRREESCGYKVIRKPHPEKSLKMFHRFILRADLDGAEICPQVLKLRYESRTPNFFEVYMKNPDRDFQLRLTPKKELQSVWTRTVRKDEYQRSGKVQENHFVDKHRVELIQRVSNIELILDELLKEKVIQQESYDRIRALQTSQEKMRELYSGPLKAGSASKDVFYQILQTHERLLVNDLC